MADRLTQLQDCLDDLLTQMYASLNYIQTRHPYGVIPGQPQGPNFKLAGDDDDKEEKKVKNNASGNTNGNTNGHAQQQQQQQQPQQREPATPPPETPDKFNAALRELAQDFVLKQQQIEYIVNSLPGIGNSEQDQSRRMKELEKELREVEEERGKKELEKEELVDLLGEVILKVKRVP
jgi:mediator of RNA polymerase II transcription subunit 21